VTSTFGSGLAGEIIFVYMIGLCPILALSRRFDAAVGLASVVMIIAPTAAALACWTLGDARDDFVIKLPLSIISVLVSIYGWGWILGHCVPQIRSILAAYVSMLAINCALLGIVLLSLDVDGGVGAVGLRAGSLAGGYAITLALLAQIRQRLARSDVPEAFRGTPLALVTLGIVVLALHGFMDIPIP